MHKIKLSPYHKIFYSEWLINPSRNDYNIVSDQFLYGNLCPDQLRKAVKNFVDGYLLFNSKIEIIDEQPYWVESTYKKELQFYPNPMSDQELFQLVSKPFNLHSGELHRFFLIKYSAHEYRFIASCHHILVSGLSAEGGIFRNLINYYNDNNFKFKYNWDEQTSRLNSLGKALNLLVNENLKQSKEFWHNKLNGLESLDLKFLRLNSAKPSSKDVTSDASNNVSKNISSDDVQYNEVNITAAPTKFKQTIFNKVKELCFNFGDEVFAQTNFVSRRHKITPYLLGQIIFAYLLYRYTGQKKFGISYPTAITEGRDFIYGAQINTSIITYNFEHILSLGDIAQQIRLFIADVKNHKTFDHRYCPISKIIDSDNKNLLDVAFIQTNLKDTPFEFAHIESAKINNELHTDLNNKLIFEQEIKNHKINFRVKYDSTEIDNNLLINLINCYKKLYQEILQDECNALFYNNTLNNAGYDNTMNSNTTHDAITHTLKPLNDYSIISAADYHKIVYEWNNTSQASPQDKMIHQLFEEQATRTPNNIAVVYQNKQLTYQELNYKSNQLAHYLRNVYQIQGDDLIAICLDRNEQVLIVILAVLKAGGAYVPIDPNYPLKRICHIVEEVKAKVLLTNTIHHNKFTFLSNKATSTNSEIIDSNAFIQLLNSQPTTNITTDTNHNHLAYVIYTSGTTGKPNGVMIEHKNLTSFILGFISFPLNNQISLNMLSTTNYGFDIFGLEYTLPLINGYTVYLVDLLNDSSPEPRLNKLNLNNYDCIQITPSKIELLINSINYDISPQSHTLNIKHKIKLLIGGEIFTQSNLYKLRELNKRLISSQNIYLEVINVYGPTETTIWSTAGLVNMDDVHNSNNNTGSSISIGRPLPNQSVYILDSNLNLMPIGAMGEIYIGGAGLARGYLNMPALDQNKFISNPFQSNPVETNTVKTGTVKTGTVDTGTGKSTKPNNRLYKTGDLARYLPDGSLEYICRDDFQVKIKGHRIELGEIENALTNYPEVREATVKLINKNNVEPSKQDASDDNKYLAAYYVAPYKLDEQALFDQLSKELPQYMIPNTLMYLDKFPLTSNGKLDKKALPNPKFNDIDTYVKPRNELEHKMCSIYAEVLAEYRTKNGQAHVDNQSINIHRVGIYDDFFRLGGNSILAIKLVHKLNNQIFKCHKLDATALFKHRTIANLSNSILNQNNDTTAIPQSTDEHPQQLQLSFAQERLWFIAKYKNGDKAYNVPLIFKLTPSCDIDILLKSLQTVVARHEILRTIIKEDDSGNGYPFVVHNTIKIDIKQLNNKKNFNSALQKDINYIFNLTQELPIKICCYQYKQEYYLSIIVHHIAFDGWSGDILIRDLVKYYEYFQNMDKAANAENISNQINNNQIYNKLNLPEIEVKYTDFAIWQRNYLHSKAITQQFDYWSNKLDNYGNLNLPTDKNRPVIFDYAGKTVVFELSLQLSMQLRECAQELNVSLYSVLLSGFYLLLRIYSGQNDVVLGTMISNRHYRNIANLVGFFVNAVVLRQQINDQIKIADFITGVFNEIVQIQLNQDIPFEKIVEKFANGNDLSKHPIFQIMFAMQDFGGEYHNLLTEYKPVEMYKTAKFDLSLTFNNSTQHLVGSIEYATSIFELSTIEGYIKTYKIILEQIAQFSNQRLIKNLNYIDDADYQKLLINYNNTQLEYSSTKMIHQLFEEQAEKTPDSIALIHEDKEISYRELNQKSNQLAHYIKSKYQICPDDLIGLLLNRDENIIIAILAVLKSGGAYVPIDPHYPDSRIQYILEDIQAKVILANNSYKPRLEQFNTQHKQNPPIIYIDQLDKKLQQSYASLIDNPLITTNQYNLAYVIYTSGTTGNPKGVEVEHTSFINTILGIKTIYFHNIQANTYSLTNYTFDIFGLEYALPLICGSSIFIGQIDFTKLDCSKYNFIQMTPSVCDIKLDCLKNTSHLTLLLGGEKLEINLANKIIKKDINYINLYGPTETTIWSMSKLNRYDDCENEKLRISIGKPLPNQEVYILNPNSLNNVPIGAIGELYIGGASLARGYRKNSKLTAEKFIINTFEIGNKLSKRSTRLYKTGDLVKYLNNGNIEYIGRNDLQVKINGQRIEISEIEKALSSYPGIKQSVITVKHKNNLSANYLIGYYVRKPSINTNSSSKLLNDWKNIYDSTYNQLNVYDYKNNFIGWNSSYTGQAITRTEMSEWRNNTIDILFKLNPRRILEIGSGSGLLLFELIDSCEYYYAFDFSTNAIQYTQKVINSLGYTNKFKGYISSSANISFEELNGAYDTTILNSVIQYFPSISHLEDLLIKIIDNMDTTGKIFIGDVRDFRLLECFAYSVLEFKNKLVDISDIEYFKIKERELLVSPEYFVYLKNNNDSIAYVELMPKLGTAINEMNCYRYDVILHINKNSKLSIKQINIDNFKKVINVVETLGNHSGKNLYIKYPNVRIANEYIKYQKLYNKQPELTLDKLEDLLTIEQLTKIFHQYGYKIKLYLDIENPLYINVIAFRITGNKNIDLEATIINYQKDYLTYKNFANNPMYNIKLLDSKYTENLKKYLATKLPAYMIPQYLIPINNIPLNTNGKIDYKSLPSPDFSLNNKYVAPKTTLEKTLCQIFSQILNISIDKIGIQDNFFTIGGNSILAIKLIAKINNQLHFKLKVVDIFANNTVQRIAGYISRVNNTFHLITNLNHIYDKLNMFMIHPAFAGAEVYVELANKLSDAYSCYGIDNYNLHHDKKIIDITNVACLYLNSIDKIRKQSNQVNKPYLLLGWSLGGQIALHIAKILEQSGYKDIYVILIDSVYPDKIFAHNLSQVNLDVAKLESFTQQIGCDPKYANKIKGNFKSDIALSLQKTPITLQYTKILLFKAMQKEVILFLQNYDPLKNYTLELQYNNIDKVINPINISLIKLENSNHFNLLAQSQLIYARIMLFMDKYSMPKKLVNLDYSIRVQQRIR